MAQQRVPDPIEAGASLSEGAKDSAPVGMDTGNGVYKFEQTSLEDVATTNGVAASAATSFGGADERAVAFDPDAGEGYYFDADAPEVGKFDSGLGVLTANAPGISGFTIVRGIRPGPGSYVYLVTQTDGDSDGNYEGNITALNKSDLTIAWTTQVNASNGGYASRPFVTPDDTIIAFSADGAVREFDNTGSQINSGTFSPSGGQFFGNSLFAATKDRLYHIDIGSTPPEWTEFDLTLSQTNSFTGAASEVSSGYYPTGDADNIALAIDQGGFVYVDTADGSVIATVGTGSRPDEAVVTPDHIWGQEPVGPDNEVTMKADKQSGEQVFRSTDYPNASDIVIWSHAGHPLTFPSYW